MSRLPVPLGLVQEWMLDALVFPRRVDGESVERHLSGSPHLDAADRLAIYQRSYTMRLLECMSGQFPALCHALGRELFRDFARQYLEDHPSNSYTLYALGERFPAYLMATRPDRDRPEGDREEWIDFMVDLAVYERSLFALFDAPGHEGKPWPDADVDDDRLALQPCLALHEFRYPAERYYHQFRRQGSAPLPPRQPSYVAIARKDYQIHTYPITHPHYVFLTALAEGRRIDAALRHVAQLLDRPLEAVRHSWTEDVRNRWIEAGIFVAMVPADNSIGG